MVNKFGWPDWKGKKAGRVRVVLSLYEPLEKLLSRPVSAPVQ